MISAFGKGEEMKIVMGPLTLACPGWGLEGSRVTTLVAKGTEGRPDVLAAQILCGAALQGARVVMLLPAAREQDETWKMMIAQLADGNAKSAVQAMMGLSISMYTCGAGWDRAERADLVYAPGLSARELRQLDQKTKAPILVIGKDFDRESSNRPVEKIRVGKDTLLIDSEGVEIPVVYDPSGPIYRPA